LTHNISKNRRTRPGVRDPDPPLQSLRPRGKKGTNQKKKSARSKPISSQGPNVFDIQEPRGNKGGSQLAPKKQG